MLKKALYIPTDEDLYQMQKIKEANDINKVNIYGYLIAKTIEKNIINGEFLRNTDSDILDIPEIVSGICWVYPQEIHSAEYAKYDADLCLNLLNKKSDKSIYNLDNLSGFSSSVQYNRQVMMDTIKLLDEKLINNPEYRFAYNNSEILNSIFNVDYEKFESLPYDSIRRLISIDPIYTLKFDSKKLITEFNDPDERIINYRRGILLQEGLSRYMKRYNIHEYIGYDITKSDDEKVKKLIKYLHN